MRTHHSILKRTQEHSAFSSSVDAKASKVFQRLTSSNSACTLKQPSRKCKQAAQLQEVLGVPQLLQHVLFRRITDLEVVPNWGCATREPCGHYVASTDFLLRASFPPLLAQGCTGSVGP